MSSNFTAGTQKSKSPLLCFKNKKRCFISNEEGSESFGENDKVTLVRYHQTMKCTVAPSISGDPRNIVLSSLTPSSFLLYKKTTLEIQVEVYQPLRFHRA